MGMRTRVESAGGMCAVTKLQPHMIKNCTLVYVQRAGIGN